MNSALLVIDIQNDYFPGGKMEVEGSTEASLRAKDLLKLFRERTLPIIHVQHVSTRPGAGFLVAGTPGVAIHDNVAPLQGEIVIQKNFPNSFRNTPLLERLRNEGISHVVIIGMMTHMCVDATTRAAFDHGLQCTVVSDACATRTLNFGGKVVPAEHVHAAFLAALSGVYAKVVSTDELISSLL
jgi:nicotinamidase-related amidase